MRVSKSTPDISASKDNPWLTPFYTKRNALNTNKAISNHAKFVASHLNISYEEAVRYLFEFNNKEIPNCEYCSKKLTFRDLKVGLMCEDIVCKTRRTRLINDVSHRRKYITKEFAEYVTNNLNFYLENADKKNIIDPFLQVNIKNITLRQFVSNKLEDKRPIEIIELCKCCEKEFVSSVFERKDYCVECIKHKSSFIKYKDEFLNLMQSLRVSIQNQEQTMKLARDCSIHKSMLKILSKELTSSYDKFLLETLIFLITSKDKQIFAYEFESVVFYRSYKRDFYLPLLYPFEDFGIDAVNFLESHPKLHSICPCGKRFRIFDIRENRIKLDDRKFCEVSCYHKALSDHEVYYPNMYSEDRRKALSDNLRTKIKDGVWTPERTAGWTKVRAKIEFNGVEMAFRSTWEAIFYLCNPSLGYEKIRIPYYDMEKNKGRIYITDFVDETQKIIYEIKPSSLKTSYNCVTKEQAAKDWCSTNGYEYKIVDENAIKELLLNSNNVEICRSILIDRSMKRTLNSFLGTTL